MIIIIITNNNNDINNNSNNHNKNNSNNNNQIIIIIMLTVHVLIRLNISKFNVFTNVRNHWLNTANFQFPFNL